MKNKLNKELAVCGFEAVKALERNSPEKIQRLYFTADRASQFGDLCRSMAKRKAPYNQVESGTELEKLCGSVHHQGVVAMIPQPEILRLLCGSAMSEKQVGGICGALLTNLSAWLSGVWFDVSMLGKAISAFANALPFVHAVELERAMVTGNFRAALPHLWWVLGYTFVTMVLAVRVFLRQMRRQ